MSADAVILIGDRINGAWSPFVQGVLDQWPERKRPTVRTLSLDDALGDASWLSQCRLAWLIVDDDEPDGLHDVTARLLDKHCPVVLSRANETQAIGSTVHGGVIVAPPHAAPVAVCAVLRTLWNQHESIRSLLLEIEILNAHNGGLATQFDKLDEELRLAAQLQREFLPRDLPSMANLDFRVLFRPAGYVSGDIYDVIRLDDSHMGFFLADAVGHGVPAALLTVYIKRSLRTGHRAGDNGDAVTIIPPHESLGHLNRDMVRQQSGNIRFATACYGIIDTNTFELTLARAGHPYPIVLGADGGTRTIEPDGGLLGVFPDEEYAYETRQLQHGDRLIVYSDGFEVAFPDTDEAKPEKRRTGSDNYLKEFEALKGRTLEEAYAQLNNRLDEQAGSLNQIDDLTAMIIDIGPR